MSLWDAHPRQKEREMRVKEAEDSGNMQEITKSTICFQETQWTGNMDSIPCAKLAEIKIHILFRPLLRSCCLRKVK